MSSWVVTLTGVLGSPFGRSVHRIEPSEVTRYPRLLVRVDGGADVMTVHVRMDDCKRAEALERAQERMLDVLRGWGL